MNNEQNNNGTSTSTAIVSQAIAETYEFPRVQEAKSRMPVKYGDKQEALRISDTETVSIDAYFFTSPTNLKLKHIKVALSGLLKAGVTLPDGTKPEGVNGQVWFNTNVRDPFHKVLKYAARQSLERGKPVSLAFTRRTNLKTGEITTTAKHGFEFVTKLPQPESVASSAVKALADQAKANEKAATAQSGTRAKRQGKKNKPLTPVIQPGTETANRIDALIAQNAAEKVNGATVPVPTPEPTPEPTK